MRHADLRLPASRTRVLRQRGARVQVVAVQTPPGLPLGGRSAIVHGMNYGPADAVDLTGLRRALVIQLRHHGDVLLTSPVFMVLKNRAPALEIDALVYAETRDMLDLHPAIAQVHVVKRNWKDSGGADRKSTRLNSSHTVNSYAGFCFKKK